uniref:putative metalloprotease CJM1_0395 family protein n=1 Tax=Candidatus Stercorousia sp. TaxID=3048886 RepID=UPI004024E30F
MAGINLFYRFTNPIEKQKEQQKAQKDALIKKNYDEIYAHELAHKSAGGALAGSIVIERNSDGIPFAGHVDIKMPSLNPNNPQKTINDANTVIRSAMAPFDPSDQDYRVAAQAQSIKMQAQAIKDKNVGNKLDYNA